jgi:hypothetical protein
MSRLGEMPRRHFSRVGRELEVRRSPVTLFSPRVAPYDQPQAARPSRRQPGRRPPSIAEPRPPACETIP